MAPTLYKLDGSPPANAVRMLADIIGLQLDLKQLDFAAKEHKSPEYLKLNPIGTIPTLKDGDFVLSDSHAIMKYLLSVYGADKSESLYPSDVRTRALVDQAMFFNTGVFFIKIKLVAEKACLTARHTPRSRPSPRHMFHSYTEHHQESGVVEVVSKLPTIYSDLTGPTEEHRQQTDECYSVLEAYLQNRKYIAADHLTIADLAVGSTANALQPIHKLDTVKFPRTNEWLSRLKQESFFKKIMIPGTEIFGKVLKASWEKNKQKQ